MATTVIVAPQLGMTTEEVRIVEWRCAVGERVETGSPLAVVESDKSAIDIEAHAAGFVRSLAALDDVVAVGAPIAVLTDTRDEAFDDIFDAAASRVDPSAPSAAPTGGHPGPGTTPVGSELDPTRSGDRTLASPAARRRAGELGVDLASVAGSGPGGRILEADVDQAARPTEHGRPRQLQGIRRSVAALMTASADIPQLSIGRTVDATALCGLIDAERAAGSGVRATDVLLAALGRALARHRRFVSNVDPSGGVLDLNDVAVALAVAVDDGVLAPVMLDCDRLGVREIAQQRSDAVEAARAGRTAVRRPGQPCATLSNLGGQGVEEFLALLTPPQTCVLAAGAIRDVVIADGRRPAVKPALRLWLTCDHRVADGTHAAALLAAIADLVVAPLEMLGAAATPQLTR